MDPEITFEIANSETECVKKLLYYYIIVYFGTECVKKLLYYFEYARKRLGF